MTTKELISNSNRYIMNTYSRLPVVLVRGEGVHVWDSDGKEYLDFLAGIAVCGLGHSNPLISGAISKQAETLMHVSNIYHIEPQIRLARLMVENSFADKVFFCNSGAEANEAAIKLARKYAHENMDKGRYRIVSMKNSFHGRTLATVTATGQERFQKGFDPLPAGFGYVPFDDLPSLEQAVTEDVCAVMVEAIQGEGGIRVPADGYLEGVRKICDDRGILLILDEVQTGMGRTGDLFAYEASGVRPDIMTLAKALGNGFPVGAMLATDRVAASFTPGTHASTFGGNPLAMAAGISVMDALLNGGVLDNCREMGDYFRRKLNELKAEHAFIREVRGRGLMLGVELSMEGVDIVNGCMDRGLLLNCTCGNVLRFVPPLIVTKVDIDHAVDILDEVMRNL
ncbi:MAG: acetylornithine transaminase [Deltaproteobacteria bacterium]|nr:acetylornithine transaminase [Deltaproteobacteria bacterium]MBW2595575.1 acetylornithine transaminase [Deltaproteobacteria bacterium]